MEQYNEASSTMESNIAAFKAATAPHRSALRTDPFASLSPCFAAGAKLLAEFVPNQAKHSHEHGTLVEALKRTEIVEIALEGLEGIEQVWNTPVLSSTFVHVVEYTLLWVQDVFTIVMQDAEHCFIGEGVASEILRTMQRIADTFCYGVETEAAFPTFIFTQVLYLISRRFPGLPVSAMKLHVLHSTVPRNKIRFDAQRLRVIVGHIHRVLLCGSNPISFDSVVNDFLLKYEPSVYPDSIDFGRLSLPAIMIQLAMWASRTKRAEHSIATQTNLISWCARAADEVRKQDYLTFEAKMETTFPLVCLCAPSALDDEVLLSSSFSRTMFSIPIDVWHRAWNSNLASFEKPLVPATLFRLATLAVIDIKDPELDAAMKQWIHESILSPLAPQLLPFDLATLLQNHDPHSKLLRHMLKAPKLFANALLNSDISPATTKVHHIMAFALMVQIESLVRGAHAPLLFPFVKALEEETVKLEAATCLLDSVNYACALFASQSFQYVNDENFPMKCVACEKSLSLNAHRCSGCKLTPYCSAECQHKHWPQHRTPCATISNFKGWMEDRASKARGGAFAAHICSSCGTVRGPKLYYGGGHGEWPSKLNGVSMSRCGRCKQTNYCSESCQAAHWKAGHKAECRPPPAIHESKKK